MPPEAIIVTIAGTTVQVPIIDDEETTLRLVEQVNDRIAAIEAHAKKIDTIGFAKQAAFAFAADLYRANQTHDAESREITLTLERVIQSLHDILKTAPTNP